MFYTYAKLIFILFFIAIILKFLTKMVTFNTNNYCIKDSKQSAILSLIIITIILISLPIYLLFVKKYFMNVSAEEKFFIQSLAYVLQLSIVLVIVIITKEGIYSIGITKNNIFKSAITGILLGVIFFILVTNTFMTKKIMNIISIESLNTFITFSIVGFVEEVVFRGYLQNRLISWLGTTKGYLITAVIFGLSHLPNRLILGGMNLNSALLNCVPLMVTSLLFGYIMVKTKNVVTGSLFHAFVDWTQTVINIIR